MTSVGDRQAVSVNIKQESHFWLSFAILIQLTCGASTVKVAQAVKFKRLRPTLLPLQTCFSCACLRTPVSPSPRPSSCFGRCSCSFSLSGGFFASLDISQVFPILSHHQHAHDCKAMQPLKICPKPLPFLKLPNWQQGILPA